MATFRIDVRNGKFVGHNGIQIKEFSENHICANGWKCFITEHGAIVCMCKAKTPYGTRTKKFVLKKGETKITLKNEQGETRLIKQFKLEDWPVEGTIGLSSGNISERRAYFRPRIFQEFLDRHDLTAVSGIDPNRTYSLEDYKNGEKFLTQKIISDGKIEYLGDEHCWLEKIFDEGDHKMFRDYDVSEATWVIIKSDGDKGKSSVLYTLRDAEKIPDLP